VQEFGYRYRAFISYSHADEAWAKWLHRALETYRVPKRLVGRQTEFGPVPGRLTPVFRDRDELATSTNLGDTLTRALQQSASQIVICSPAAAKSRWVNEEVLAFKRLGREHRVFCLIVDGEPGDPSQDCFAPALLYRPGVDGQLTEERSEPIAADARPGKDGKADVKLKLIAGILGVGLDELKQREAHRRQMRMMLLAAAAVSGMAITSTLAVSAWLARNEAERQRARAEYETETAGQTMRFMVDLFKVSDPSEALGNTITARDILNRGAERIDRELAAQPDIQATLMDTMGTVYMSLGLLEPAERLTRRAYDKRRTLLGSDHALVIDSLQNLGAVLTEKADYVAAQRYLEEALQAGRELHGARSAEAADTLSLLAAVHQGLGQYERSDLLLHEALAIRKALHVGANADVAQSLEAVGVNFGLRGEYAAAVAYLREALAMRHDLHRGAHPALAQAIDNLSSELTQVGEVEEAERLARQALAMKRRLYGDVHPEIAAGVNNLAIILDMREDFAGAEQAYREALEINRQLLGDEHPSVAINLNNLALTIYARGDHSEGVALLREALDMRRRVLGEQHPAVAGNATSLAYWLIDEGEYDEASRLLEEGLSIRIQTLGARHPQVAGTLTVKANLRLAQGRYEEARTLATEARAILLQTMTDDTWQVGAAKSAEGEALTRLRRYGGRGGAIADEQPVRARRVAVARARAKEPAAPLRPVFSLGAPKRSRALSIATRPGRSPVGRFKGRAIARSRIARTGSRPTLPTHRRERTLWGRCAVGNLTGSTRCCDRRVGQEAAAGFSVCTCMLINLSVQTAGDRGVGGSLLLHPVADARQDRRATEIYARGARCLV
jgi:tetratricopeptide (TPR) repeat protein